MRCFGVMVLSLAMAVPSLARASDDEKDYKDVPLDQVGVTPVKPKKDAKTGFIVGGKNATSLIRTLTEINGRKIAALEKDMRPGASGSGEFEGSRVGFLGKDEKLLDVLAMDNKFVVDKLGLTRLWP